MYSIPIQMKQWTIKLFEPELVVQSPSQTQDIPHTLYKDIKKGIVNIDLAAAFLVKMARTVEVMHNSHLLENGAKR